MRVALYYTLLLAVLAYAWLRGGSAERIGASIALAASLLTQAAYSPLGGRFDNVETAVLAVDVAVLGCFVTLALHSERYWPIWVSALQLIGVLAHIARLADPSMIRPGYAFILAVWSYPTLALIAAGTWRHHRRTTMRGS